ncbi:MAG TPA: glycosyltransferase [Candidatus Saccharimonadales bacterium]|nr:glycosyltransferase [Candidatus Saccharimonadales bacterium]
MVGSVIFSPAELALNLTTGLHELGADVTLFTPGPVDAPVRTITADLSYFEEELAGRGDSYTDLLKKHPFTFITLARQVQAELIARAYDMANRGELDIIHIYTNEEELALPFAALCRRPVVFTHHDPFNFLVKYKNVLPKYARLNWISLSYAQRAGMPADTNWVANIYHGLPAAALHPAARPTAAYIAFLGRIIEPKGLHLAIAAVRAYNASTTQPLKLKIAGKHYAGHAKDTYWQQRIAPQLHGDDIEFVGFVGAAGKQEFLANARALLVPSLFAEPFGMVSIEALACGTPVIALDSGALPEVIKDAKTGYVVPKAYDGGGQLDEAATAQALAAAIGRIDAIDRHACRADFEARFTAARMCREHLTLYEQLTLLPDRP